MDGFTCSYVADISDRASAIRIANMVVQVEDSEFLWINTPLRFNVAQERCQLYGGDLAAFSRLVSCLVQAKLCRQSRRGGVMLVRACRRFKSADLHNLVRIDTQNVKSRVFKPS